MHKIIMTVVVMSFLGGCVTAQQRAQKSGNMNRDIRLAMKYFTTAHEDACIERYKSNMHDPSSFQKAGDISFDRIITNITYGTTWDSGPARRVVYSMSVRGKNAYGGLVLGEIKCYFGVNDNDIHLFDVRS